MKKILSLTLAAAMAVAALPVAYAAENEADYSAGTQITLVGTQENQGEQWIVTVPAKMVPGDTGTVKAEGMWNSNKFLWVTHPSTVTLTYGAQTMDVAVTGNPIGLIGNSFASVSKEVDVSIEEASRLFGTWEGILEYQVDLIEKGDVNQDGIIDKTDWDLIAAVNAGNKELTDEELPFYDINDDGNFGFGDYAKARVWFSGCGIELE